MIAGLKFLSLVWLGYLALELALYWAPLLAVWAKGRRRERRASIVSPAPGSLEPLDERIPNVIILSACRDGAVCVPGLAKTIQDQDYPANARRLFLVADHCSDDSAAVARQHGMTVLERKDPSVPGKGNAVSDMTDRVVRHEAFDVLVVLDIDARVDADFLRRAAAHFATGADVVSFSTQAKNPTSSLLARAGDIIQTLLRLHQSGRAALGLDAILYGSHGYALSRRALERLDWRTTTGQTAEDMELCLRARLAGLSVRYAGDIVVFNDVTTDAGSVLEQRMRWNATYLPLIPPYAGALLRAALHGNHKSLEALVGLLLLPSFANLFLYFFGSALVFGGLAWIWPSFKTPALIAILLLGFDLAYFAAAFAITGTRMTGGSAQALVAHLVLRAAALIEAPFHLHTKDWAPAPHSEDR